MKNNVISRWAEHDQIIKDTIYLHPSLGNTKLAIEIDKMFFTFRLDKVEIDSLRNYISRNRERLYFNEPGKDFFTPKFVKEYNKPIEQLDSLFNATETELTETKTKGYKPKKQFFTAVASDGKIMNIETYCKFWGLDFEKVRSFKLVTHTGIPFYNIAFYESDADKENNEIDFTNIFKDKIEPVFIYPTYVIDLPAVFDRAVISDTHIGMEVNKDGYSLYPGEWNEKEIFKTLEVFVNEIIKNKKSNKLLIHELGDYLDGWDGMTTRGGHKLPQNMDNQKAFDVGLLFKIKMLDALFLVYDTIEVVNICNDNHAGSFGYIVNSAFKTYAELKYGNSVKVTNQRKFIDHYIYENRCFILTHGKDEKSMKFGFKPKLDPVQIEKIKDYIDEYKLHNYIIEFSKGDSHQLLFDSTTSASFEYQNFGAISPPSDWVKTNFKNTLRCFTTFNYYEDQKTQNNYIFKKM
jgi:hypothetical protein